MGSLPSTAGRDALPDLPMVLRLPLPLLGLLLVLALLAALLALTADSSAWLLAAILTANVLIRLRQKTVLDRDGIAVVHVATKRVPWHEVKGFEPKPGLGGGITIVTTTGSIRSAVPCSWWGGPPSADQVAALERVRRDHAAA